MILLILQCANFALSLTNLVLAIRLYRILHEGGEVK